MLLEVTWYDEHVHMHCNIWASLIMFNIGMTWYPACPTANALCRRIDVDNSFKISWPEFASYFGQSLYSITGTDYPKRQAWVAGSKSRNSSADRLAQAPSTSHQTRDAELKDSLYEDATREAERLADMLERTESFISHQASEYEERVRILEVCFVIHQGLLQVSSMHQAVLGAQCWCAMLIEFRTVVKSVNFAHNFIYATTSCRV